MSTDWDVVQLRDVVEASRSICYGIVQPGVATTVGVPIVRVGDVRDGRIATASPLRVTTAVEAGYARSRLQGGELLLTLVGTVGETAIVPMEMKGWNVARAIAVIPIRDDVGSQWVRIALRTPAVRHLIHSRVNTTVQTTLNLRDVAQLPLVMPPLEERLAIARMLGALEEKIELNRCMSVTLEELARAVFKSWFVDFEPVRANAEAPDRRGASELAQLFPEAFDETVDAPVPRGWHCSHIGEIATNVKRAVRASEIDPVTPYIALEHMPKRSIALAEWEVAGDLGSNKWAFKRGEILFGKLRPYFHKVGVAPVDGICSTDIVVVAPKEPSLFGLLLGHLCSDAFVQHTDSGSTGTRMPRTSWTEMSRYRILLPEEKVATAFTVHVRALTSRVEAAIHESRTLAALRDTLLPKLISGELRIRDAERSVSDAV